MNLATAEQAELEAALLPDRATVYSESGTGALDNVVRADLPCALIPLSASGAPDGGARAELLMRRVLCWESAYVMPERAQVVINGDRWALVMGTIVRAGIVPQVDVVRVVE